MPDVREAFEAVTAPPEPGARERQHRRQRRAVRKRRVGALAVSAAIVIGIVIVIVVLGRPHGEDGAPPFVDEPTVDAPAPREDDTYLLTIGDGTLTPLPSPVDGWSYRFSLDGSQVAFTAMDASGDQQVYRMQADGTGMTQLTGPAFSSEWAVEVDEPAWSPDGDWLVISGTDAHSGRRDLYFLSSRRLPTGGHAPPRSGFGFIDQASEPIWSPDGRDIAFTAGGQDIQIVRTERYFGGKSITTAGPPESLLDGASSFSWSIDGTQIVFIASDTGLVSIADADGTNIRAIADAPSANPSWSPDGASIAYDDLSSGRIAIYDMTSGATRYLDVGACAQGWADAATLLVTTECEG